MIETLDREFLGTLRKGTASFLATYKIENITRSEASKIDKILKDKFCINKNCYFYSEIDYDGSTFKVFISVMVYLTALEWPNDKYEQEIIMNKCVINTQKFFEYFIMKNKIWRSLKVKVPS